MKPIAHCYTCKTLVFVNQSTDEATGEVTRKAWKAARTTTVFHVSQTEPLGGV